MFPGIIGDDNRGKATAWSLFGSATAVGRNDESRHSSIQSLNATVDELAQLVGNGAKVTSAVAGFFGDKQLAQDADKLHRYLLK